MQTTAREIRAPAEAEASDAFKANCLRYGWIVMLQIDNRDTAQRAPQPKFTFPIAG